MSPTLVTKTSTLFQAEYLTRTLFFSLLVSVQSVTTFASLTPKSCDSPSLQKRELRTSEMVRSSRKRKERDRVREDGGVKKKKEEDVATLNAQLLEAAYDGNSKEVEILLKAGADKEVTNKDGLTPLHRAVKKGHGAVVELLINAGATKDAIDKDVWTPLHWAAYKGTVAVVEILLKAGANKEAVTKGCTVTKACWTPLHVAAHYGQKAVVEILLRAGAKKEAVDEYERTPLHVAALCGKVSVVEILLTAGVEKEAVDEYERTPLHVAALCGKVSVVEILLTAGANKEAIDKDDRTPLHLAAHHGHGHVARELLNAGVNKDTVGKDGCTPLHLAAEHGYADEVVELLLRAGANFGYRNNCGETPLAKALAAYHKNNNDRWQKGIHMLLLMARGDASCFSLETLKLLQQNRYDYSPFEALFIKSNKLAKEHYQALVDALENQGIPKVIALLILEYYKGADIRIRLFKKASPSSSSLRSSFLRSSSVRPSFLGSSSVRPSSYSLLPPLSMEHFFPPPLSSSSEPHLDDPSNV